MSIGYTTRIVTLNKDANGRMIGVKLGRLCIKHDLSVIDIADRFNVSRQAVYNWFVGINDPKGITRASIEEYVVTLKDF